MTTIVPGGLTPSGQFAFAGSGDVLSIGPVVGSGSAPSIAAGPALGTGASVSIIGTNAAGLLTMTTGTLALVTGIGATLTLAASFAFPTRCFMTVTAGDINSAGIAARVFVTSTTSTATLNIGTLALGLSTSYSFYYHVFGY